MTTEHDGGFSLTELLVAMLVTMVVSGAVFGLMTAGQGSFRREPALTDRQQNIRVAMDMIQRDVATGGAGMEVWVQAFARGDGVGETNPLLDGRGPVIPGQLPPSGRPRDHLQILGTIDCPAVPIEVINGTNLRTSIGFPSCYPEPGMVAVTFEGPPLMTNWGWGHNLHSGDNRDLNFPPGQQPPKSEINNPNDLSGPPPASSVIPIQIVRYEIALEADGVPGLWRSAQGGIDVDGNYVPAPGAAGNWRLVARGIEDLQVRYRPGNNGAFEDSARRVVNADYTSLTREVEVTLWARAIGPNLQGFTTPNGAPPAVRGSMVSVHSPRAALLALRDPGAGAGQWR